MVKADALAQCIAPLIHPGVIKRDCVEAIALHQGMRRALGAMGVEFALEELVYRVVEREGGARRTLHAETHIEIRTPWALGEEVYLRTTDPEGFLRRRIEGRRAERHII